MILRELLNDIDIVNFNGDYDLNISGVSFDSKKVKEGFGEQEHPMLYVEQPA